MHVTKASASRMNTFLMCSFKYLLNYEVYICQDCNEPTYITEMKHFNINLGEKKCMNPKCGSMNLKKLVMPSNWGAKNGSIIHDVLQLYATARKEGKDDWRLDWRKNLIDFYLGDILTNDALPVSMKNDSDEEMRQLLIQQNDILSIGDCSQCRYNCMDRLPSNVCPRKIFDKSLQQIGLAINRYDQLYEKSCLGIEHEFNICLDDQVLVNGFFDVVFNPTLDTIEIVDYKTGKSTKTYDDLKKDIQARIYSLAVKHDFPGYKNYFLTFDYFNRSPITVTFSNEEDEWTRKNFIEWFQAIEGNIQPTRIPLNRDGTENFKCCFLCNRAICDAQWAIFQKRYGKGGL